MPGKVGKGRGKLYDTMESRVGHMLKDEGIVTDELQKNEKNEQSRRMQVTLNFVGFQWIT